jgi:hypothetical protein
MKQIGSGDEYTIPMVKEHTVGNDTSIIFLKLILEHYNIWPTAFFLGIIHASQD